MTMANETLIQMSCSSGRWCVKFQGSLMLSPLGGGSGPREEGKVNEADGISMEASVFPLKLVFGPRE